MTQTAASQTPVTPIANAVMRGVVRSGCMTEARVAGAVEIMRDELKEFLAGERYADARACLTAGSLHQGYVLGLIIAECVTRITALPA